MTNFTRVAKFQAADGRISGMSETHPTRRPTDEAHLTGDHFSPPPSLLNLPWIDSHNHAQTLSWEDREEYALTGCRGMIMVASGYHWTPYKPVAAEDIRFLWDDIINRRRTIERNHFFDTKLALGVHTGVPIENPDVLFDAMDAYCGHEAVAALGETGITPAQHVKQWGLDEQRAAVRTQMELADEHDLPLILHTPNQRPADRPTYRPGVGTPGYEKNTHLTQAPVLTGKNPALKAVEIDIELAAAAGLSEEQLVASHADSNNVAYLLEETDCYVSFTLGYPWLTGATAADVAEAIETYGSDRILVETDCANVLKTDVRSVKRAILELYRLGIDEDAIRQVVLTNPSDVFGFAV